MAFEVEHVVSSNNLLGEGPIWHSGEGAVYWVDINQKRVERYLPATGERATYQFDVSVCALGVRESGGFVSITSDGFAFVDMESESLEFIHDPEADKPSNRFNDGKTDPYGRFWGGTLYFGPGMDEKVEGSLYRLDPDLSVHMMDTQITIANGMDWSPDHKTMYFTDTLRRIIYAYDYDRATGAIENRRDFITTTEDDGLPDGMCVDSEGFIWSTCWGAFKVLRFDPNGQLERTIPMPVGWPSSCCWGGPTLSDLYITTARTELPDEQRHEQPTAGDLYVLHTDIVGQDGGRFSG
jgi:L-arabinonolactonase